MQLPGEKLFKSLSVSIVLTFGLLPPCFAGAPKVVTDIKPVHSLVAMVMTGVGEPDLIIGSGASPHDFSLRPSQARMLQEADAVFWIGKDLTPWLSKPIGTLAPTAVSVELLHNSEITVLNNRASDGHDHGDNDPHAWLDPENAKVWLIAIAGELANLDPENREIYHTNAVRGRKTIDETSTQVSEILDGVLNSNLIVYHDAYRYFETRFGLSVIGAISLSEATPPSAARIAEIRQIIKTKDVRCIFSEPQFNSGLIATVTSGSKIKHATLDPLGFHLASGAEFYSAFLKDMAVTIKSCAGL